MFGRRSISSEGGFSISANYKRKARYIGSDKRICLGNGSLPDTRFEIDLNGREVDAQDLDPWIRDVRTVATASSSNISSYLENESERAGENHLQITDTWRKLVFQEADRTPLLISEEIFRENMKVLLDGIDFSARNPTRWSRPDSNFHFNKIQSFVESWKRQLLKEHEKLDEKFWLAKDLLASKCDLVANRISLLRNVIDESMQYMNFTDIQNQAMASSFEDLNEIQNNLSDDSSIFQEAVLTSRLKERNRELLEAKKLANQHQEELRQVHSDFRSTKAKLNSLILANDKKAQFELREMQDKLAETERQLAESNRKNGNYSGEIKKLRDKLIEAYMLDEKTQNEERETQEKLCEIRSLLMEKFSADGFVSSRSTDETKQILRDISTLIAFEKPETVDNDPKGVAFEKTATVNNDPKGVAFEKPATVDNDPKGDIVEKTQEEDGASSSVKVTEYEMHLITLIAAFLRVTPFPVSSRFIHSYVAKIDNVVDVQFIDNLMKRFPSFFKEITVSPGATDKIWTYMPLKPVITI